jgi:hypothetical protein
MPKKKSKRPSSAAPERAAHLVASTRGRPRTGETAAGSRARSLRLPDAAWAELEREAKQRKLSLHKLLRVIVAEHLAMSGSTKRARGIDTSVSGSHGHRGTLG